MSPCSKVDLLRSPSSCHHGKRCGGVAFLLPVSTLTSTLTSTAISAIVTSVLAYAYLIRPHLLILSSQITYFVTPISAFSMAPRKSKPRAMQKVPFTPTKVNKTKTRTVEHSPTSSARTTKPPATYSVKRYKNGLLNLENTPPHLAVMRAEKSLMLQCVLRSL